MLGKIEKLVRGGVWPSTARPEVNAAVAAAGSTQATATLLTADVNIITSCTAGSAEGVILPAGNVGDVIVVANRSGATGKVYPGTGGSINGGTANASVNIATTVKHIYICSTDGASPDWIQIISA